MCYYLFILCTDSAAEMNSNWKIQRRISDTIREMVTEKKKTNHSASGGDESEGFSRLCNRGKTEIQKKKKILINHCVRISMKFPSISYIPDFQHTTVVHWRRKSTRFYFWAILCTGCKYSPRQLRRVYYIITIQVDTVNKTHYTVTLLVLLTVIAEGFLYPLVWFIRG